MPLFFEKQTLDNNKIIRMVKPVHVNSSQTKNKESQMKDKCKEAVDELEKSVGFQPKGGTQHSKDHVLHGIWNEQEVILRLTEPAHLQAIASCEIQAWRFPTLQVTVPKILAQGRTGNNIPWHMEEYLGATVSMAHDFNNRPAWFTPEETLWWRLWVELEDFWSEVVPPSAMTLQSPAFRIKYWVTQTESILRELHENNEKQIQRLHKLAKPFASSGTSNPLLGLPLTACHGHLFSTSVIREPRFPSQKHKQHVGICEFDKNGYYVFGYDLIMEMWYRWMRLTEDDLQKFRSFLGAYEDYLEKAVDGYFTLKGGEVDRAQIMHWLRVSLLTRLIGSCLDTANRMKAIQEGQQKDKHDCLHTLEDEISRLEIILSTAEELRAKL